MLRSCFFAALFVACALVTVATSVAATFVVTNLKTSDLGYSSISGLAYAAVPNASATNPNTLTPINPSTGGLNSPIPIGFDPARIAVSSDGTKVFTVIGGQRAVQRYNIPTASADQLFSVSGGPQFTDMYAVPGRPNAVVLHEADPGTSPPAVATVVFENAVLLPHQVGHGVGVGGPDIFAVDPADGTKAYGYQNTISSYDNVPMLIGPQGIDINGPSSLQGILTGNVGHIAITGDRLFDSNGHIYSMSLGFQVGTFLGGSNFLLDPSYHRLFSLTTSGTTQTIRAYSLDTLGLLGTDTVSPISGTTSSLIRFGSDGLAFRTSNDQVVFLHSPIVTPEPSSLMLAIVGLLVGGTRRTRKQVFRIWCAAR